MASESGWGPENFGHFVPNARHMTREQYAAEQQRLHDEYNARRAFEEALEGWPWKNSPGRALTVAPFVENPQCHPGDSMSKNYWHQDAPILKYLAITDFRVMIMSYLTSHRSMAALALTCRQAFQMVSDDMNLWNMSTGDFNISDGRVGEKVLVAPTRVQQKIPYADQMVYAQKMTFQMAQFSENFRNIYLHRVPFVNVKLLSIVLPHMRNLKLVGIYNCELIHFGHTEKLLEIVRTDKMKGKQVALDFYPRYHIGPRDRTPNIYSGSYGVTWDNAEIDTCLAIWKIVHQLIPQARAQGVDLESTDSAFRKWLDKSPCWEVARTLSVIASPTSKLENMEDICNFIAQIDYPTYKGSAKFFASKIPNRVEGWRWATEKYPCAHCEQEVLGIFYDFAQIRQHNLDNIPANMLICLGCKLIRWMDNETDHYKIQKDAIMDKKWLRNDRVGTEPLLSQIITKGSVDRGFKYAQVLDLIRLSDLEKGYDKEESEVQTELPLSKGKYQWYHHAPQVDEQDGRVTRRNYAPYWQRFSGGHF